LDLNLTELISFWQFWALWLANLIWKFWSDLVGNSKDLLPKSFLLSWHCEWMQLFRKIEKCLDESVAMLVSNKDFTVAMVLRWVRWNWRHASEIFQRNCFVLLLCVCIYWLMRSSEFSEVDLLNFRLSDSAEILDSLIYSLGCI